MTESLPLQRLIHEDPDFVNSKRFGYSLTRVLDRYPESVPDHILSQLLMIEADEIQDMYEVIVNKLRVGMGVSI